MSTTTKKKDPLPMPAGWREIRHHSIIATDDKIWQWGTGPWVYVGGGIIGERYNRLSATTSEHFTIIRRVKGTK